MVTRDKKCNHIWVLLEEEKVKDNGLIKRIEHEYCVRCTAKRTMIKVNRLEEERK